MVRKFRGALCAVPPLWLPVRLDPGRRMRLAAAAAALLVLVLRPAEAGEAGAVTCGSVVKLLNPRHGVRLHSHDVRYGSGTTRGRRLGRGGEGGRERILHMLRGALDPSGREGRPCLQPRTPQPLFGGLASFALPACPQGPCTPHLTSYDHS